MMSFFRKLGWLRRRSSKEAELQQELQFHLEEEAADRQEQGVADEEAWRAARRELGNLTLVKEDTRAVWTWTWLEQLGQDIRYALRAMAANKSFTALAALSLALGIGANTAIFSFMDSILLRSLPVSDPQSLVILSWRTPQPEFSGSNRHSNSYADPNGGYISGTFSYPAFQLLRDHSGSVFSSVFGYQGAGRLNLTFRGQAGLAQTEYVSGDYFGGLGTPPSAGRLIGPDDDRAGSAAVAVISFALSQRRFGGPENAPGQSVLINNLPFTVIGVTPPDFFGADPDVHPDIYVPLHANLLLWAGSARYPTASIYTNPNYQWVVPMARLRPGVTAAQAQAAMAGPFYQWGRAARPTLKPQDVPTLVVREGAGGLDSLRRKYSKPLYILLTLVGLILVIACANIANLLLARAAARKREIAVRLSMGAGRFRIVRQLLTESVLLGLLGGALGIGFAIWGIHFLTVLLANGQENFTLRAELNRHVLGVVAGLSVLTGILFGLVPALQATRVDVMPALKESRTGEARGRGFRPLSLSRILMVSQIALALLILVAAGLFVRTLSNLGSIQLGFNSENVLTFQLNARQAGHNDPEIVSFYQDLQRQFSTIPGVRAASLANHVLLGTGTSATDVLLADGARKNSRFLTIGTGFFHTMEIPIVRGRDINDRDGPGSPMVAVVNEAFGKLCFGDRDPLGQHFSIKDLCPKCDIEIVGISKSSLFGSLKKDMQPIVFLPFSQGAWGPSREVYYHLRTAGNPLRSISAVRELVRRADDRAPVAEVKTQKAWIDQMINQEIVFARLCTAFAVLALAIACVGLYGTMSYNVARRTSEIGIRMALGAPRRRVVWMVLREVMVLAAVGLAISVPTALAASKVVESFLFGMKPNDLPALAGSVVILLGAALVAGYLPAWHASRIDPMVALRHE